MAVCGRCGRVNDPEALFCQDCGEPQEIKETSSDPETLICPACGNSNPESTRFCRTCGVRLAEWTPDADIEKTVRSPCPFCGKSTPKGFAFCQFCGSRIAVSGEDGDSGVEPTPPAGLPRPVTARMDLVSPPPGWDESMEKQGELLSGQDVQGEGVLDVRERGEDKREGRIEGKIEGEIQREIEGEIESKIEREIEGEIKGEIQREIESKIDSESKTKVKSDRGIDLQQEIKPDRTALLGSPRTDYTSCVLFHEGAEEKKIVIQDWPFDIGKSKGQLRFPQDSYLSDRHARIIKKEDGFALIDLESVNGVYLKVNERVKLDDNVVFCIGSYVLLFERLHEEDCKLEPAREDGVLVFGSPLENVWGRVRFLTVAGVCRGVVYLSGGRAVLGRHASHICFPEDPLVAPQHAAIEVSSEGVYLESMGPDRPLFLKLKGHHLLRAGDVFKIGLQKFRFEPHGI